MRIIVCGSAHFGDEMRRVKEHLVEMGHEVVLPLAVEKFDLKSYDDAQKLKGKKDYITHIKPMLTKVHFDEIKNSDAIFVVNTEKNGIKNYIGGATFAEIMVAFCYGKKIFFLNPLPDDEKLKPYTDELASVGPVVINGDFGMVR